MNYSHPDMSYMRRDALRRTREMHRQNINRNDVQAQNRTDPVNMPFNTPPPEIQSGPEINHTAAKSTAAKRETQSRSFSHNNSAKRRSGGLNSLFSGFFTDGKPDNDKIIIIALIVILAREGADIKLLMALGYILM